MKILSLPLILFLTGCATTGISEIESLNAIKEKASLVKLSRTDNPQTIQTVGELLYIIDKVGGPK
jgi:hypothetical protein